jgi:cytochrome c-type biogenesis protein CcmH
MIGAGQRRGRLRLWALLAVIVLAGVPALAVQPDEVLSNPVLEGRARTISAELRCLVCQNQSIDDSAAPLARDLRLLVRERLKAGDTDGQVRAYLVARYGDFVLLKPPFKLETLLLWGTPLLVVILGGLGLWWGVRSRGGQGAEPLDLEEERRLKALLREP